jgi:hypothetical protein
MTSLDELGATLKVEDKECPEDKETVHITGWTVGTITHYAEFVEGAG